MFDALNFCKDFNIHFDPYSTKNWINIACPLCGDKKFHGGLNITGGYYNCWKCGGNELPYIISRLLLIKKSEAAEIVLQYTISHINILNKKQKTGAVGKITCPGEGLKPVHRQYLKNRGFTPSYLAKKYRLLGTLATPLDYSYRLIIPIFHRGKLISYQGRDVTGKHLLRYKGLSPEESVMNYKHTLYGLEFAEGKAGVVEGIFDAWAMGDGFVASYGTALTEYQIQLLARLHTVYFVFDTDAQKKAKMYAKRVKAINQHITVEVIDLELGDRDPGDLTSSEAMYFRKQLGF